MNASTTTTTADTALLLLSDRTRRRVLRSLIEAGGDATVEELVEAVVDEEPSTEGSLAESRRVAIELHHTHLPKLREAGLIERDTRSDAVRYRPDPLVEDLLGVLDGYAGPD